MSCNAGETCAQDTDLRFVLEEEGDKQQEILKLGSGAPLDEPSLQYTQRCLARGTCWQLTLLKELPDDTQFAGNLYFRVVLAGTIYVTRVPVRP